MAKYILATNTEVSLLSFLPSLSLSLSPSLSLSYHFEKLQSIMHTQRYFGEKCPFSKLTVYLTEPGCFTHHPQQTVPLLPKSRQQSDILSLMSNLLFIGLSAFLPQDLCTCCPLIQMAVPRSLHNLYHHLLLIPSQMKLSSNPALTAHFKVQTPLSHPWPAPLAPSSLPPGDRKT